MKKLFKLFVLISFAFCLMACSNITLQNIETATLCLSIDNPDSSRTAVMAMPSAVYYVIQAKQNNKVVTYPDDKNVVDGTNVFSEGTYNLNLGKGDWDIEVWGYKNEYSSKEEAEKSDTLILYGKDVIKNVNNGKYYKSVSVFFIDDNYVYSQENYGSVELEIKNQTKTVSYMMLTGTEFDGKYVSEDNLIKISRKNVTPKNYQADLSFYNSEDVLLYKTPLSINVRKNLCTDKWVKTSSEAGALHYVTKKGVTEFILTSDIIEKVTNTDVYVSGSGNDSNNGTSYFPYASVKKALAKVNALNNEYNNSKEFTIYVSGKTKASEIYELTSQKNLKLQILGENSSVSMDSLTGNINFTAENSASINVEIKNLKIEGELSLNSADVIAVNSNFTSTVQLKTSSLLLKDCESDGQLIYDSGNLVLSGKTGFRDGIVLNNKKLHTIIDSQLTSDFVTEIKVSDDFTNYYKKNAVIFKGSENYPVLTKKDMNCFEWKASDEYTFGLSNADALGNVNILLTNSDFDIGGEEPELPVHSIIFTLSNDGSEIVIPETSYGFTSITISVQYEFENETYELKNGDSFNIILYSGTTEIQSELTVDEENDMLIVTADNIYPGVYSLKVSAFIEGIYYSANIDGINVVIGG